jgi:hypothetical protein
MTDTPLIDSKPPLGSIIMVNLKLMASALLAFASYWSWPTTAIWWHFGVLSIFLGAMAFASLVNALRLIVKLWMRERTIRKMQRIGTAPKSASLAGDDTLRKAGVIDE